MSRDQREPAERPVSWWVRAARVALGTPSSGGGSGPAVACVFHRLLAVVFLIAWLSLGSQVMVLIGSRGLMPIAPYLEQARAHAGLSWHEFPTLFWIDAGDATLYAGIWVGVALAMCALLGLYPRMCFALSSVLYLSYVTAARGFMSFQWDSLLIETGVLAALLPRDRPAWWIHTLLRLLLFKLYFESGIAKWRSHLHDWHDGSAMTYYYETAPIPTWLAWYAHALPDWWHRFESRAAMWLELIGPLLFFGPRLARRVALIAFTGFMLIDIATANYGFFCYLTLALHVLLLDDRDVTRVADRVRRMLPPRLRRRLRGPPPRPAPRGVGRTAAVAGAIAVSAIWVSLSAVEGVTTFRRGDRRAEWLSSLQELYQPLHVVNAYHLFGHITRERIEPELQTYETADQGWQSHDFRYKPGDPTRPPPVVAPHQPRVDFQLWFYGLSYRGGTPGYVRNLLARVCTDPRAVQSLFAAPLPARPTAVRVVYYRYWFTTPQQRRDTGHWWRREVVAKTQPFDCP